jgi:hypothetical protein
MSPIAERVAVRHPAGPMHAIMIGHYDAAYEACVRQDGVVEAMRDSTDRGPGDDVDHAATRAQLDEQAAVPMPCTGASPISPPRSPGVRTAPTGCECCRQYIPIERLHVPGGNPLRAVQAAGAATLTKNVYQKKIHRPRLPDIRL